MEKVVEWAIGRIRVEVENNVEENAARHYNDRQRYKESHYANYDGNGPIPLGNLKKLDRSFLYRITVNYIRHELTEYDESLWETKGKVGCHEFYFKYRDAVLDKIAEAYPKYRKECERQKSFG